MSLGAISRRSLIAGGVLAASLPGSCAEQSLDARTNALHARVLTIDSHVDIPLEFATPAADPAVETTMQVDLPKMRAGGLGAAFFVVFTPQGPLTEAGFRAAQSIAQTRADAIHRMTRDNPDRIGPAASAADAKANWRAGRLSALIGMENAYPLGRTVDRVAFWKAQGVRYVGLAHVGHNQFADSANHNPAVEPPALHNGLSPLGRHLIEALNDAGVMVDVSHASRDASMQAIALSRAPAIASHAASKSLADNPRNLDDDAIAALAAKGGVIQIVALGSYLRSPSAEQVAARLEVRRSFGIATDAERAALDEATNARYVAAIETVDERFPTVAVSDLIDHVDHVVTLAGVDHVGIASDFGGGGGIEGWNDASESLAVTRALVARNYSDAAIAKIWGGNLLRVMESAAASAR